MHAHLKLYLALENLRASLPPAGVLSRHISNFLESSLASCFLLHSLRTSTSLSQIASSSSKRYWISDTICPMSLLSRVSIEMSSLLCNLNRSLSVSPVIVILRLSLSSRSTSIFALCMHIFVASTWLREATYYLVVSSRSGKKINGTRANDFSDIGRDFARVRSNRDFPCLRCESRYLQIYATQQCEYHC